MAKTQTFSDKAKGKGKSTKVTIKFVKTEKTDSGNYKFNERFVKFNIKIGGNFFTAFPFYLHFIVSQQLVSN